MSHKTYKDPVFFLEPDKNSGEPHRLIAMAVFDPDREEYTTSGGQTLHEMHGTYPGIQVGDFDEVILAKEAFYRERGVYEIDETSFNEALNSLPPMDWVRKGGVESFKLSEFIAGNIVWIYCRVGERYFRFYDSYRLNSDGISQRLEKGIQEVDAVKAAESAYVSTASMETTNVD